MNVFRSAIFTFLILSQAASAVKMDETTHDMVIQRLEYGLDGMEKSFPERTGILLRLADLYADRARLKAMNEAESNCKDCKGALNDRKKAIASYQEAMPKAEKEDRGRLSLQIAHLYALNDETKKSNELYISILKAKKNSYPSDVRAIAFASVAEQKFRNGDFKGALKDFESARKENVKNRALVEFRIAWCQLNLGQNEKATKTLVHLLKTPELLATQTTDGKTVDAGFVTDISHDLAIFLARSNVGPKEIDLLKQLSPQANRKENLHMLATETDRQGKKASSLIVWAAYVDEGDVQPGEKLEVQTRVAQIYYDMNRQELAANAYEKALDLWTKLGCKDATLCDDLKARLRKFVTAWNKSQKINPTENLLRIYISYTRVFPTDTEMLHWGGIVARDRKNTKQAIALFHQAATQSYQELQKNPSNKTMQNIFEGSLLAEIEMAETSKDTKAQEAAYNFYLQLNPNGGKSFEIRYQRAHLYYSSNRFQESFSEFHYLASMPSKEHRDLSIKSADLSLDSLVALKDDKNLQVRSLEYARFFPERKTEYLKISRKATMNIVAADLAKAGNADRTDYHASLVALNAVNMDGADDVERIKFYKNKIVIAEKALDVGAVKDSSASLLGIKKLSAEDKEWTMTQQVWAAQLELNFALAYRLSKQMKLAELSKADRELRLALLLELSGQNPRVHNENYLKLAGNTRSANLVRVTMIKNSSAQWKELDKQLPHLRQTPDLLAGLTLEVFAAHQDYKKAEHMLKTTNISRYAAGQTLQRHLDLKEFSAFDRKIRAHRIYGFSDHAMQKTLKERMKLLNQSEKYAQSAFKRHDWTLQTLALTSLARENRRLYHDIQSLPVPSRLSAIEKQKYQQLLKNQSLPYLTRAEKIEREVSDSWSESNSVQNLQAAYMTATPELQRLYRDEIIPLAVNAPSGAKNRLDGLLNTPYRRPSQKDILLARQELQSHPFDISKAERLRELESHGGRPAMVVYLDERISQLKKGKSL